MIPQTLSYLKGVGGDQSGRDALLRGEADAVKFEKCAPYIREWMEKKIEGGIY
jgi:hypothetical protein